uniref:Uncharacterized protein n=1 Tax=Rhizophora mucronata TaxID=61149 RepID=A0A2P2N446_RHIMU
MKSCAIGLVRSTSPNLNPLLLLSGNYICQLSYSLH